MALTASDILSAIAPKYDTDTSRDTFLEMARMQTSESFFGPTKYEKAVALRAAHEMFIARTRKDFGEAGTVSSKSEGQLAMQFAGSSSVNAPKGLEDLLQTAFGLELLGLIQGADLPARLVGTIGREDDQ